MKSKAVQFLEANQSDERSTFVDDAKWRQENASWLKQSQRIACTIMDYMQNHHLSRNDVAEKLEVTPRYVSSILSGKMNFTLKTISLIEERLGLELFWYSFRKDELHVEDDFINRRTSRTGIILHLDDFNSQKRKIITKY